jgi:hypothetical protein
MDGSHERHVIHKDGRKGSKNGNVQLLFLLNDSTPIFTI